MSWLLDTDVICQPAKKNGDARVIVWLEAEQDRCYTSAVVIAQLAYWVRTKEGRQRQALQAWLTRLVDALHGRIHGFNVSVAHVWAEQERLLDKAGHRMPVEDGYVLEIEGDPSVRVRLGPIGPHFDGATTTAMPVVNAIPAVVAAPPGIVNRMELPFVKGAHLLTRSTPKAAVREPR